VRKYLSILVLAAACGGGGPEPQSGGKQAEPGAGNPQGDPNAVFGPLRVGADYKSFTKVSTDKFQSPTHGKRFVEIWVNEVGLAAYQGEDEFPVGTIIVKESWENDGKGGPTEVRGPLFVMEKRAKGYDSEHNDWHYEFHWENVPEQWAGKLGGNQIYWRSPSKKVDYCSGCHDNYDREVGLPAKGYRVWEQASK
jgi:hypothetical protein